MHRFVRNFITEWRRLDLSFSGGTIIVAVSGGADSVSLLLAVNDLAGRSKLGHRIVAAHFNHCLRGGESDDDEKFVRALTTDLGIELAVARGVISTVGNLEQNARNARYDFLRKTAGNLKAFAVLTGHSINDQAETFLINLIRGSGPDGLAGMRTVRSFDFDAPSSKAEPRNPDLLLVRPLLTWAKRIDTETFCRDLGVEYRYDTMNEDTAFKRVRVRKILLPLLADFNPNIVEILAGTAGLMQNLSEKHTAGTHSQVAGALILGEIAGLPRVELFDKLRTWLKLHRGNTRQLQLKHIEAAARLVLSKKSGKTAEIPGGQVVKTGGKLVYVENRVEK